MMRPDHHHEALRNAGFNVTQPTQFDSEDEKLGDIYGNGMNDPINDDDDDDKNNKGERCGMGY